MRLLLWDERRQIACSQLVDTSKIGSHEKGSNAIIRYGYQLYPSHHLLQCWCFPLRYYQCECYGSSTPPRVLTQWTISPSLSLSATSLMVIMAGCSDCLHDLFALCTLIFNLNCVTRSLLRALQFSFLLRQVQIGTLLTLCGKRKGGRRFVLLARLRFVAPMEWWFGWSTSRWARRVVKPTHAYPRSQSVPGGSVGDD